MGDIAAPIIGATQGHSLHLKPMSVLRKMSRKQRTKYTLRAQRAIIANIPNPTAKMTSLLCDQMAILYEEDTSGVIKDRTMVTCPTHGLP